MWALLTRGETASLEAGRSPGESCSSTAWRLFSLVCSFGKCRFAINLAENLKFCALETICTFQNCA